MARKHQLFLNIYIILQNNAYFKSFNNLLIIIFQEKTQSKERGKQSNM